MTNLDILFACQKSELPMTSEGVIVQPSLNIEQDCNVKLIYFSAKFSVKLK